MELFADGVWSVVVWTIVIFLARLLDVGLATFTMVTVAKGNRRLATFMGFFKALVWIVVISQVVNHMDHPWYFFIFALGYSVGTYIGMTLEQRYGSGMALLRIITEDHPEALLDSIREKGHSVVQHNAHDADRTVHVYLIMLPRKEVRGVLSHMKELHPGSFYAISDIRSVKQVGSSSVHAGPMIRRSDHHG